MNIQRVLETALYVDDLAAARQFYEQVLGARFYSEQPDRHVFFRVGRQMLLLFDPQASSEEDGEIPPHGAVGPGHVAFAVEEDELEGWERKLQQHGVEIERRVQWPGGARSIYFRDPAGNSLELAMPAMWLGE